MIKLVVSPDNRLCFDLNQKLAGESLFIANERAAVIKFLETMQAKEKFQVNLNLADDIAKKYLAQILSTISLGKKSGELILGKEKINDYLKKNIRLTGETTSGKGFEGDAEPRSRAHSSISEEDAGTSPPFRSPAEAGLYSKFSYIDSAYIIQATDASEREKFANSGKLKVCTIFDSAILSKACGRDNTKYALITNKIAELFKKNYSKYNCYIKV